MKLDGNEFLINEGLINEFNIAWIPPPGYSEAKPGETFLKIGVGEVVREEEKNYEFWRKYKLRQPASTSLVRQESGLSFSQSMLLERLGIRIPQELRDSSRVPHDHDRLFAPKHRPTYHRGQPIYLSLLVLGVEQGIKAAAVKYGSDFIRELHLRGNACQHLRCLSAQPRLDFLRSG